MPRYYIKKRRIKLRKAENELIGYDFQVSF